MCISKSFLLKYFKLKKIMSYSLVRTKEVSRGYREGGVGLEDGTVTRSSGESKHCVLYLGQFRHPLPWFALSLH